MTTYAAKDLNQGDEVQDETGYIWTVDGEYFTLQYEDEKWIDDRIDGVLL